jgi:hypothetical protein
MGQNIRGWALTVKPSDVNVDIRAGIMNSLCGGPLFHIEFLWRSGVLDQRTSWVEARHRALDAVAPPSRWRRSVRALSETESRSQKTYWRQDEERLSDCWPDWNGRALDPSELKILAEKNAPGRVLYETVMILAPILGIALLVGVVPTVLRFN